MNPLEQLEKMLQAYYPVLYLTTFEYRRTQEKLKRIAQKGGYTIYNWNCVDGLNKYQCRNGTWYAEAVTDKENPIELLSFIKNAPRKQEKEIYVLEDFHEFIEEREIKLRLRQAAEDLRYTKKHIIIVSSVYKLPKELEKYITVLNMPLPDEHDLRLTLQSVVKSAQQTALNPDLEKKLVDAALGMTVMEADLAYCLAVSTACNQQFDDTAIKIVTREKEQIIKKNGILEYYPVNESMKNIGGMENLKKWLEIRRLAFDFRAEQYGLSRPKGLLLTGVPGCGKSLAAKCIAALWDLPLLRLDVGRVFEGIVGSSEANIRQAIHVAETVAPCVLWVDEIEKGLSGVKSSGSTDGGTTARIFSTLLTWMQEKTKSVFVVATANDISQLPPELYRKGRFDKVFFVDLPTKEERQDIFKIHLERNRRNYKQIGLERLAENTKSFNGAEIEACIQEAMFTAYLENQIQPVLKAQHILEAIKTTVPLAHTKKEDIEFLRKWAKTRAEFAGKENTEFIEQNVILTPKERELQRSFKQ